MVKKLKEPSSLAADKRTRIFFMAIIILYTLLLYGNTIYNRYSLDDNVIQVLDSKINDKGINAIGEIFTTTYTTTSSGNEIEKSYGYRPILRLVFALEYAIFGAKPGIAHLINILFYLAVVLLLYRILQRIFSDYSIWFPFVIILLFIAHPVHTEVVASLKNRDELLSMLFSLLTLQMLFKYHDKAKVSYLVGALLIYVLAFLSKPTALAFWFVYPLTLYFFTDMKWKKILTIFGLLTLMIFIAGVVPFWFLERVRNVTMVDNPLYFEDSIWNILGTGMLSLGYYIKLLVIPHPLLYYYGYDMIPVVNLANPWVILSIVFHLSILAIAIWKAREKHPLSYAIFFYLFTIAMYANIYRPVPGIIGERFLLVPSVAFAIVCAWFIFKLFKANPQAVNNKPNSILFALVFTIIILAPYSYKVVNRNKHWKTQISLYQADMKHLENSVKAHDLMGTTLTRKIEVELSKHVNVAKFMMPDIHRALGHFKRATEIYPGHTSSFINMGMIYNNPRIGEHLIASGDTNEYLRYKRSAVSNFKKALELEPENGKALFNLAYTYEGLSNLDSTLYYYERCIRFNPQIVSPRSRMANLLFMQGKIDEAIELNRQIIYINPNEAIPYVNFGNYYMMMGDTLNAITNFEEAATRNARPEVFAFLAQYYTGQGNNLKAGEYTQKYNAATRSR